LAETVLVNLAQVRNFLVRRNARRTLESQDHPEKAEANTGSKDLTEKLDFQN
jgi:hypothetical protein